VKLNFIGDKNYSLKSKKAHAKKHFRSSRHLGKMSLKDKQALLSGLFGNQDDSGIFHAIYLTKDSKGWTYNIYGGIDLAQDTEGRLNKLVVKGLST
jgi:hypothetical protein